MYSYYLRRLIYVYICFPYFKVDNFQFFLMQNYLHNSFGLRTCYTVQFKQFQGWIWLGLSLRLPNQPLNKLEFCWLLVCALEESYKSKSYTFHSKTHPVSGNPITRESRNISNSEFSNNREHNRVSVLFKEFKCLICIVHKDEIAEYTWAGC